MRREELYLTDMVEAADACSVYFYILAETGNWLSS